MRPCRVPGEVSRAAASAVLVLASAVTAASGGAPSFTEQAEFGQGSTIAVAWGDAERDGDLDLAVGNYFGEANKVNFNQGNGSFVEEDRLGPRNTFALAWGDWDNDGDLDVAVGNGGGQQNRLFTNAGDGTFTAQNTFGALSTVAVAWADADLDGDLDVAVGNGILGSVQQNFLYLNNGDGTFTEVAQFGTGQTASVTWSDYDGDGDPDLAAGNGGFGSVGQNYLYVNNGDGTFTEQEQFGLGDTSCLVWGDYDNDGDPDLAVANWNGGQNLLYVNNGDGSFTELERFGLRDPNTMAWGDFDNDGDLDLAVGNGDFSSADQNYLYVNEGGGNFTESAQFGLGSTDAVAWGDFDADGDLDLAAGNEHTPTQNYLYVNHEDDGDYLFLRLVGRFHEVGAGYSNRDGVGAKVRVYEAGFVGDPAHLLASREIEAHGGFAAQNAMDAHFGLPGRSTVDVRITWPGSSGSHLVQDLLGAPVGSRAVIEEGTTATAAPAAGAAVPDSPWRIAPNPTRGPTTLRYLRALPAGTALRIVDAGGREVRSLPLAPDGQSARARWDGRDAAGSRVAPGVYFVRLPGKDTRPARVLILR